MTIEELKYFFGVKPPPTLWQRFKRWLGFTP